MLSLEINLACNSLPAAVQKNNNLFSYQPMLLCVTSKSKRNNSSEPTMARLQCHAIKNKIRNHSIK